MLRHEGLSFETENDSEVAAGYLTWRMREGASLKQALTDSLDALDGFYTFVVGTESGFAVMRDPIACKPAVMAETDRLCRLRFGIPRAGHAARYRKGAAVRTRTRQSLCVGTLMPDIDLATSPRARPERGAACADAKKQRR